MEAWRQRRRSQRAECNPRRVRRGKRDGKMRWGSGALKARMRRCLILRQGASPLRPPAPFPSESMFQNGSNRSRVRKPRNNGAPLTDSFRSEETTEMRERGPSARRAVSRVGEARYARMRRCLIHRQGASPLRPPYFPLDREWPSHGSRDREGAVASEYEGVLAKRCTKLAVGGTWP